VLRTTRFVSIKVLRQAYFGVPSIAIFINDVTKKMLSRINEKLTEE